MLKNHFSHPPSPTVTAPARPEAAKTATLPRDAPLARQRARIAQTLLISNQHLSDIGMAGEAFPIAKSDPEDERPTRSAVRTSRLFAHCSLIDDPLKHPTLLWLEHHSVRSQRCCLHKPSFLQPTTASPTIGEDQVALPPGVAQSIKYLRPSYLYRRFRRSLARPRPVIPQTPVFLRHGHTTKRTRSHDQGL